MYRLAWLFTLATLLQFCKGGHISSEIDNLIHPSSQHRRGLIQGAAVIGSDVSAIPEQDKWPYTLALARCTQNSTSNSTDLRVVCGASLIHPYVALTAAHCIKSAVNVATPPPSTFCVIHGNDNITEVLADPISYTIIAAQEIAVNPTYLQLFRNNEFHITGDVALLFLSEPIDQPARPESWIATSTSNPGYALLPKPSQNWDRSNFGFFSVAIGWGITENATADDALSSTNPQPQRLEEQRITFQVAMSPEECTAPLFFGMEEQPLDTLCGAWFGGFDYIIGRNNNNVTATICKGDSGGPLVIPSTMIDVFGFQGDVQIGIVSAGPPCPYVPLNDTLVWPAEYVDVSQYVEWIHSEMKQRGLTPLPVATSPLNRAYRDQTCYPGNCYEQDLMQGIGNDAPTSSSSSSGKGGLSVRGGVVLGGVAGALAVIFDIL